MSFWASFIFRSTVTDPCKKKETLFVLLPAPEEQTGIRAVLACEDLTELMRSLPAASCHPMPQHRRHAEKEKLAVVLHLLLGLKAKFPIIQVLHPVLQQFPGHTDHPGSVCFGKIIAVEAAVFPNIVKKRLKAFPDAAPAASSQISRTVTRLNGLFSRVITQTKRERSFHPYPWHAYYF